jgi:predicted nucleic acid-binding protein
LIQGFVADASVGVAWATQAQANEGTQELKREILDGRPFVVPVLWPIEVANGLLMLFRRKRINHPEWSIGCRQVAALDAVVDQQASILAFVGISKLAEQTGLTTYDATYLELAIRRQIPLASRDTALNKAAKKCGVRTLL